VLVIFLYALFFHLYQIFSMQSSDIGAGISLISRSHLFGLFSFMLNFLNTKLTQVMICIEIS
jgi:hypothetical protein